MNISNAHTCLPALVAAICLLLPPPVMAAPACDCKDLPAMVKEIIEQEYLAKKFREWSEYMPREVDSPERIQKRAQAELDAHFNNKSGNATGTTDGAHAALGTAYNSKDCTIGEFQYNKQGKPVNKRGQEVVEVDEGGKSIDGRTPPKDNEHHVKPLNEKQYLDKGKQCEALLRFAWLHEQHHQNTCRQLNAAGQSSRWDSMEFFARDDAEAYKAGTDFLREEARKVAFKCGWEGSTGEHAVPTPARAKELAAAAAKTSKNRGGGKSQSKGSDRSAKIITGPQVDTSPMDELLALWQTQCQDDSAPGCGALGTSIEAGLVNLIQWLNRKGDVDRQTLLDSAHGDLPQLKQLAMRYLHSAQSQEEVEFALRMTEHPSPGVREAAHRMLQGSEDPRWKKIAPLWQSPRTADYGTLVPDQTPRPEVYGLNTFEGLTHRPFGTSDTQILFTTSEPPDAVVKRVFKGKTVMSNAEDLKRNAQGLQQRMMALQKEVMQAAQSGDMARITELSNQMMALQQKVMPTDPMAINTQAGSIGILLEKDATTGLPNKVARIRRDEITGQTLVIFERRASR